MSDEKYFLSKEEALKLIGPKESVHVFLNPGVGMIIGADWSWKEITQLIEDSQTIEIGGEECKRMKHDIVAFNKGRYHFIERGARDENS